MNITFYGAAHEVTGSMYLIETDSVNFLVDCGMEQGINCYENKPLKIPASEIDFVLLTHAHIDHSGNLPLLYAQGFRGNVITTFGTADLCEIMLRDSAHIQEFEAQWRTRKSQRRGGKEVLPAYTLADAEEVIAKFKGFAYDEKINIANGVSVIFKDAGHLLGSASIELFLREGDAERRIVFSGDIGNTDQPLIRDPVVPLGADYVIMESTYGDRSHGPRPDYVSELAAIVQKTFDRGGDVIIPSFAVGRTQEILYFLREIKNAGIIKGHGDFDVWVDSPLAVEATNIFLRHHYDDYDEEALALVNSGINPISFPGLKTAVTSDESKAINFASTRKIIISASGMCDAGRIKHHLKHGLWKPQNTVLFCGYQSVGTLGRSLVEGAKSVKIFGEEIEVLAEIRVLAGVSGHADNEGLMSWIKTLSESGKPKRVFVTHGDDNSCETLARRIADELGMSSYAPFSGTEFDLIHGNFVKEEQGVPFKRAETKPSTVYDRLVAAGQRLVSVIKRNKGLANKESAKFADQINSLCDKWE